MGFLFQSADMKKASLKSLQFRKNQLVERLRIYELDNTITALESFDPGNYNFIDPTEAGERLLILLAISFAAYNFDETEKVMNWLKKEELWQSVSEAEKQFFRDPDPDRDEKQKFSWRFEAAYMLAWCLGKVSSRPRAESECSEQQVSEFLQQIPSMGSSTSAYFDGLGYRSLSEILDETLFYQVTDSYFKALVSEDKENTSSVHAKACRERFRVLSWLTLDNHDWDSIEKDKEDI